MREPFFFCAHAGINSSSSREEQQLHSGSAHDSNGLHGVADVEAGAPFFSYLCFCLFGLHAAWLFRGCGVWGLPFLVRTIRVHRKVQATKMMGVFGGFTGFCSRVNFGESQFLSMPHRRM